MSNDMPYNWAGNLGDELRAKALDELKTKLAMGLAIGDVIEFELALAAWRSTGEVHDDPELYAQLTRVVEAADLVEVERPSGRYRWVGRPYRRHFYSQVGTYGA